MDPIKTARYGLLLTAAAAIAGAYFEAKHGNKLLTLGLLTTATLSIGASLRPDVFVKNVIWVIIFFVLFFGVLIITNVSGSKRPHIITHVSELKKLNKNNITI